MRRLLLLLAAVSALALAATASASASAATLNEQGTGAQTSAGAQGCQTLPGGCVIGSAGTITGTPIQQGTFTSTLTIYYTQYNTTNPNYAFCAPASGSATLSGPFGTISKDESGQVCASSFGPGGSYTFDGTYTITGGTGAYTDATGSGTVHTYQPTQTSPFTVSEVGTINTPTEQPGKGCGDKNHLHENYDQCGPQSP